MRELTAALARFGARLRPMTADDRGLADAVYISTRLEELAATGWPEEQQHRFLASQAELQRADYDRRFPDARRFIIEVDGEGAGRLFLDERGDALHILDIALLPPFRRRGLGGAMIAAIKADAEAQGRGVTIFVEQSNPAMSLYRRLGFRRIDEHGVYEKRRWDPAGAGDQLNTAS